MLPSPVPFFCFVSYGFVGVLWFAGFGDRVSCSTDGQALEYPELLILLCPLSEHWDYRCESPQLDYVFPGIELRVSCTLDQCSTK